MREKYNSFLYCLHYTTGYAYMLCLCVTELNEFNVYGLINKCKV